MPIKANVGGVEKKSGGCSSAEAGGGVFWPLFL